LLKYSTLNTKYKTGTDGDIFVTTLIACLLSPTFSAGFNMLQNDVTQPRANIFLAISYSVFGS